MKGKGLFITFEGGEGSGKTTQINKIAGKLADKNIKVITTREPGGTPEAEKIRELLVQRDGGDWPPMAECLLLYAARAMHVEQVIRPALKKGKVVISDRFFDSTLAYQGYGRGLDTDTIKKLNTLILGDFRPDITFILDVDPQEGIRRSGRRLAAEKMKIQQTEDRFENLGLEFHQKLRQGFLDIAEQNPERCHVINALDDVDRIAAQVEKIVMGKI